MNLISLITVSGDYINNITNEIMQGKEINFWINDFHKRKLNGIQQGDMVAIFLAGEGLMFLGKLSHFNPISNNGEVYGEHSILDTFNIFSNIGIGRLGLATNDKLNNFISLINNVFSAQKYKTMYDPIISLMVKPYYTILFNDGLIPIRKVPYNKYNQSTLKEIDIDLPDGKIINIPVPSGNPPIRVNPI